MTHKLKSLTHLLLPIFLVFAMQIPAFAQEGSLEETLQALSEDAAASYLNPIASAYGSNLNAGWFHRAPDPKIFGIDIELGIVAMGTYFNDDNKSFSTSGSFRFSEAEAREMAKGASGGNQVIEDALVAQIISEDYEVEISGATIIGEQDDYITIAYPEHTYDVEGQTITVPTQEVVLDIGGFSALAEAKLMPLMAPQFSLGTVYGTQATFRWLPNTKISDDLGSFSYFGFGLQHNPAAWLPYDLPLNVAASFYTQKLSIGDLFETTAIAFGLNVSKEFGFSALNITPYAGFMLESSKMRVQYEMEYDPAADPIPIDFTIEGENKTRATLGLSIRLLLININADYNIGQYKSVSAGLTIRI